MHLKEKPFRSIWEGNKTIELRLYDEKRRADQGLKDYRIQFDLPP